MKVLAYTRVSTDKQVADGHGLDVQEAAIRAWARTGGYKITGWHADEGISGSNGLDTRNGLPDALAALRQHQAAGLVVYRLDRLARDLILQETLLREIRSYGAELFTTSASEAENLRDDPGDPSRKLIRQILGAVSEYERELIKLRLHNGRRRKAERGGYAYGSPPYGQRAADGELAADAAEQLVIARMREMRAQGLSLRGIAAELNAEGVPPKRGPTWYPATVARAIARAV